MDSCGHQGALSLMCHIAQHLTIPHIAQHLMISHRRMKSNSHTFGSTASLSCTMIFMLMGAGSKGHTKDKTCFNAHS